MSTRRWRGRVGCEPPDDHTGGVDCQSTDLLELDHTRPSSAPAEPSPTNSNHAALPATEPDTATTRWPVAPGRPSCAQQATGPTASSFRSCRLMSAQSLDHPGTLSSRSSSLVVPPLVRPTTSTMALGRAGPSRSSRHITCIGAFATRSGWPVADTIAAGTAVPRDASCRTRRSAWDGSSSRAPLDTVRTLSTERKRARFPTYNRVIAARGLALCDDRSP